MYKRQTYNQINITNEFILDTIEYCIRIVFKNIDLKNPDTNIRIVYDILKNTLNVDKIEKIYTDINNIFDKSTNNSDKLDILYNIKLNKFTITKYKSKIIDFISSYTKKNIITENITQKLQSNDKQLIPNINIDKLSANLQENSTETILDTDTEIKDLFTEKSKLEAIPESNITKESVQEESVQEESEIVQEEPEVVQEESDVVQEESEVVQEESEVVQELSLIHI